MGTEPLPSTILLFPAFAYLLCAVPFGKIIAHRFAGIDVTRRGSGNIGATNVAREAGLRWGILTLALDTLKGYLPVLFLTLLYPGRETMLALTVFAAVVGHQFSFLRRFQGGKGVATALGVHLAVSPVSCLAALVVFIIIVALTDYISLGSILAALSMPLVLLLDGQPAPVVIASLVLALLIALKHKENLYRLRRGEERKWRKRADHVSRSSSRSNSSSE